MISSTPPTSVWDDLWNAPKEEVEEEEEKHTSWGTPRDSALNCIVTESRRAARRPTWIHQRRRWQPTTKHSYLRSHLRIKKPPSELLRSHRSVVRTHVAEAVVAEKRRRINILQPSSSPSRTAVLEPPEVCDWQLIENMFAETCSPDTRNQEAKPSGWLSDRRGPSEHGRWRRRTNTRRTAASLTTGSTAPRWICRQVWLLAIRRPHVWQLIGS